MKPSLEQDNKGLKCEWKQSFIGLQPPTRIAMHSSDGIKFVNHIGLVVCNTHTTNSIYSLSEVNYRNLRFHSTQLFHSSDEIFS